MKVLVACICLLAALGAAAQALDLKVGAWEMTHKSAALPHPVVEKECVTKADLAQLARGPDPDDDDDFTAESPERVRGTIVVNPPKGGKTFNVDIAGRWHGASCSGIK
ncbi:hypothetical protein [Methylibium sp.]|uniref:hypothetical protein n=1 Tax=Methylibium sp. TaxID=2067992 RepID=UPI003D0B9F6D